jgi:hypothetical protein
VKYGSSLVLVEFIKIMNYQYLFLIKKTASFTHCKKSENLANEEEENN